MGSVATAATDTGHTDLEGLCGLPDDPAGVGGRGLGRRAQAPLPLVLLLLHALPHQSERGELSF